MESSPGEHEAQLEGPGECHEGSAQQGVEPAEPDPFTLTEEYRFLCRVYGVEMMAGQSVRQFRERIRQQRENFILFNLPNYGYSRSHHYHFFLEDFPRVEGQPTYALDLHNVYQFTYPQDQRLYRGQPLAQIINRVAFTLPPKDSDADYFLTRKRGDSHNPAHALLFANENAKIELDRVLVTSKKILQHFSRFQQDTLRSFSLAGPGSPLSFLLDGDLSREEKRSLLERVIGEFQQIKREKAPLFDVNDFLYFGSSLQQKLHDSVQHDEAMEGKMQRRMVSSCLDRYQQNLQLLDDSSVEIRLPVCNMLLYYKTSLSSVSEPVLNRILKHETSLRSGKVRLPLAILDFGSHALRQKANLLVSHAIHHCELQQEESLLSALGQLLASPFQLENFPERSFLEAKFLARTAIGHLQGHFRSQRQSQPMVLLDDLVNWEGLEEREEPFELLSSSAVRVRVGQAQVKTLFYYHRVCKILRLLEPVVHQSNQMLEVLCSQYFQNLIHGFIGHIPKKAIAKLPTQLKHLASHALQALYQDPAQQHHHIELQLEPNTGTAILWSIPQPPESQEEQIELDCLAEVQDPLPHLTAVPSQVRPPAERSQAGINMFSEEMPQRLIPCPLQVRGSDSRPRQADDNSLLQGDEYPFTKRVKLNESQL